TITPVAPASCAFFTLKMKEQPPPRSISASCPVKNPAGNVWHPSVVVPTVPTGEPGNGAVEPSLASLMLPVICVVLATTGLKAAGNAALFPAIAAGELTCKAAFC